MAANWTALARFLEGQGDRVTMTWAELEQVVGTLPPSATRHAAFWSGDRPHTRAWRAAGFQLLERQPGRQVVFGRITSTDRADVRTREPAAPARTRAPSADVVLISCSKEKADQPCAAQDLYRSPLFAKMRSHAQGSGHPWFILSAEHGLVAPDEWLAPYERYLPDTSRGYRAAWGEWVVGRLELLAGDLAGRRVEVHAGRSYVEPLLNPLERRSAEVVLPLLGLRHGERLAWYDRQAEAPASASANEVVDVADELVSSLIDLSGAMTPDDLRARPPAELKVPGLYSWWVDEEGAAELRAGLGHPLRSGLIYAGLAGATRWPSGRASSNTLWSRLVGMHLGKKARFSTFRLTLGSTLATAWGEVDIDEARLTTWMEQHLRVIPVPWHDADRLKAIEHEVLKRLDPPLNLDGMERTDIRRRLTELRRGRR